MDIKKQIDAIRLIKHGLNLNLVFTTDEAEIRASVHNLRSKMYLGQHISIEHFSPNKFNCFDSNNLLSYLNDQMVDLITFIQDENVILPPIVNCATNYIDWIEQSDKCYMQNDGFHRAALAHVLKLNEIPYIVRPIQKHIFSISKNDFVFEENKITVIGPVGQKMTFLIDDNYIEVNKESETIEFNNLLSLTNPKNFK